MVSKIRREQTRNRVAQFSGQRAAVHFGQAHFARGGNFFDDDFLHFLHELASVALDVQFKIQPQLCIAEGLAAKSGLDSPEK